MNQDQQTFRRASNAALIGLATQFFFTILVAGLGLYTVSSAINAAAWHLLGGIPIWIILWMLYNQHRLERVESLEAEQIASDSTIFDEAGHQLASARKRLDNFYKWGLPVISVLIAIYLLAIGLIYLIAGYRSIDHDPIDGADFRQLIKVSFENEYANPWMVIGLSALMAFLGFLVARYVAGMTRVKEWQMLRGGAAFLIGNVVVVVLIGVAAVAQFLGNNFGFAVLALLVPLLMIFLGIETLLALLFGIYRPRKADEVVRPAFDSRLLGWLTQPESLGKIVSETLNYQFGFEITRSWFYVLLAKALAPLIAIGVAMLIALTCCVIVAPQEQAVVTTLGKFDPATSVRKPGLSFKLPWPVATVEKFQVTKSQQIIIGTYDQSQRIAGKATLWTNEHVEGDSTYMATAPTRVDDAALQQQVEEQIEDESSKDELESVGDDAPQKSTGSSRLGGLIAMQCVVTFHIQDLEAYVSSDSATRPEYLLSAVAENHLNQMVATQQVDDLLGAGRIDSAKQMLADIREAVGPNGYNLGLAVTDVLLYDVHPPNEGEVADSFLQQVNALQTRKTAIENARRDAIGTLSAAAGSQAEALSIEGEIKLLGELKNQPEKDEAAIDKQIAKIYRLIDGAGGEAAQLLAEARQTRWRTALNERSEGNRFAFELAAYKKAPQYFKARYYLDAMSEAFSTSNRRVITAVETDQPSTIRLNLEDATSAGAMFTDN